jgi:CRP-like cAMP-binding protein
MAENPGATGAFKNAILSHLSPDVVAQLTPDPLRLALRLVLYEPNKPIAYAYFPEEGVISVVAQLENGSSIEIGTIGREGLAGSVLLLGVESVPFRHFIQIEGFGHRVSARRFLNVVKESAELRDRVLRYEASFRTQTMQGMACNGMHNVEQRCCRWLLMTRDRVDSNDLKLTHEFLGLMLGVRRPSVTDVLAPLQTAGLVKSNRGTITILDRSGLEKRVCECYRIMAARESS